MIMDQCYNHIWLLMQNINNICNLSHTANITMDTLLLHARKIYYFFLAATVMHTKIRWSLTLVIIAIYLWRSLKGSYDVVTYLIGFFAVQLLIGYCTPQGLDEDQDQQLISVENSHFIQTFSPEEIQDNSQANNHNQELQDNSSSIEKKPLLSQLSEYQIWLRTTSLFLLGILCTKFKQFQIDVFWPILMLYFIGLIAYTIIKIVRKMQKYKYSIADFGKKILFSKKYSQPI